MIEITILGTSCMVPTKDRNVSSAYAEIEGVGILFDCGEGTQRQMNIAGKNRNKVRYIFISHWHADHVAGILGLIQTIGNKSDTGEEVELDIFGPIGTKKHFQAMLDASVFDNQLNISVKEFDLPEVTQIMKTQNFSVEAVNLEHSTPCIGFSLIENNKRKILLKKTEAAKIPSGPLLAKLQKGEDIYYNNDTFRSKDYTDLIIGKKFTYVADTMFTPKAIDLSENSDIVLSEATYAKEQIEKAKKHKHLTSTEAGMIASQSNSKKLLLTHFSQRYSDPKELLDEARDVFPETEAAFDFQKIKLK